MPTAFFQACGISVSLCWESHIPESVSLGACRPITWHTTNNIWDSLYLAEKHHTWSTSVAHTHTLTCQYNRKDANTHMINAFRLYIKSRMDEMSQLFRTIHPHQPSECPRDTTTICTFKIRLCTSVIASSVWPNASPPVCEEHAFAWRTHLLRPVDYTIQMRASWRLVSARNICKMTQNCRIWEQTNSDQLRYSILSAESHQVLYNCVTYICVAATTQDNAHLL